MGAPRSAANAASDDVVVGIRDIDDVREAPSAADVGREMFAGEGGTVGDEVGGYALEDDPAAVAAGRQGRGR